MAPHMAGSPIPSAARSLRPPPSAGTSEDPARVPTEGQGALCSREGGGFRGMCSAQHPPRDGSDVPSSPLSALATALGVVRSPRAPATVGSAAMEGSRGDPVALPSPARVTPSCSSAPGCGGRRGARHRGRAQAASPAPGTLGPGGTMAPRAQDAATNPHIPALLPGTAPVRRWDGKSLPTGAGWRSWGVPAAGVAGPGSRRASPGKPWLNIPHLAPLPCPASPRWDGVAGSITERSFPWPGWLLPPQGTQGCSATPVPECRGWQPKTSLESFLQPRTGPGHAWLGPTEAGKQALIRGVGNAEKSRQGPEKAVLPAPRPAPAALLGTRGRRGAAGGSAPCGHGPRAKLP